MIPFTLFEMYIQHCYGRNGLSFDMEPGALSAAQTYTYIVTFYLYKYFVSFFESTLLNYANLCRNWSFQRFVWVAEKKGRNGTNVKSDTR